VNQIKNEKISMLIDEYKTDTKPGEVVPHQRIYFDLEEIGLEIVCSENE